MPLHDAQEFDNDLGAWPDQDLALSGFLGIVDGIKRIVEHTCSDHDFESMRFSNRAFEMRYLFIVQVFC
jgi:hypothetical protein